MALALADLPFSISGLLNDDVLTFPTTGYSLPAQDVPIPEVSDALARTINGAGRTVTDEALDMLAAATAGQPFMIQLVGYHAWRKAQGDTIDTTAANQAIPAAQNRLGATVHATDLNDLSEVDRTFLIAMVPDKGPSRTSDVASRIGVSAGYANVYRRAMIRT